MAATLEEIRLKNRQLAESNLNKQGTINEVRSSWGVGGCLGLCPWLFVVVCMTAGRCAGSITLLDPRLLSCCQRLFAPLAY
jgi:hypothetical protein